MAKVALITVHGMGPHEPTYADEMRACLERQMGLAFAGVDVHPVYYQGVLKPNEKAVWERTQAMAKVRYQDLRRFILFGFGDAAGLENRKEYDDSVYELAQREIANALLAVYARGGKDAPIVFLSHSLGCQVLSSFIYDAQKHAAGLPVAAGIFRNGRFADSLPPAAREFLLCRSARGWVSTGCNIPVFVAAHQYMHVIPIARPNPNFRWLNLYDPDDVLGWPLEPLGNGYETLVEDRAINAGQGLFNFLAKSWNPLSHSAYWTDDTVIEPLAAMLRG